MTMARNNPAADVADLDAEIARIEAEIGRTERTGPTLAQREADALAWLDQARAWCVEHGFEPHGSLPGEREHYARPALIGAMMTTNGKQLIDAERARIRKAYPEGLDATERDKRVAERRRELRMRHAKRKMQLREREARGEDVERDSAAPEVFLRTDTDLRAILQGKGAE